MICNSGECFDDILLYKLQEYLDKAVKTDTFIVLHQLGSHGPAYYKRYPKAFEVFTPALSSNQLQDAQQQEIINAYDNSILYTDYFLTEVIDFLKNNSTKFDTGMIYVSDHGESLGENNIYLHGLPFFIAPQMQIHVPFILWLSDKLVKSDHIDKSCLEKHSNFKYSHDNLFHSFLGLMGVNTAIYKPELDLFAKCK
jgi:lipid A ethanolaminephosphotransferase